jgi:hypothetical protein
MRQGLPVFLLAGAAVLLMGAAGGGLTVHRPQIAVPQTQPTPPGLRGPQSGPARATAAAATPAASRPAQPAIASVAAVDPHQCRMACAQPYYFCLAGAAPEPCPDEWRRCVVGCDWPSPANGGVQSVTSAPTAR